MNKCIDESIRNNQYQCSKCNKLVVLFILENRDAKDFDQKRLFKFDLSTSAKSASICILSFILTLELSKSN